MWTAIVVGGFVVIAAVQVIIARAIARQQRTLEQTGERLSHLVAALSLLTDSTESGLRDIIVELERAASTAAAPRRTAGSTRRITAAARRGRSVQEIAAAEQVSEGEVKLRLQLGGAPTSAKSRVAAAS